MAITELSHQANEAIVEEMERTKWKRVGKELLKDWRLYTLLIPLLVFIFLFKYLPIKGILLAFKRQGASLEVLDYNWNGLYYMRQLFRTADFWRAFRNTFVTSLYGLVFGFPIPIFIALLFSEIKNYGYRSVLQVATYLPKFLSTVVTSTIIILWCQVGTTGVGAQSEGLLAKILFSTHILTRESTVTSVLSYPQLFRPIYIISGIWEGSGYGSIVYFAAVLAISPTNYEAAKIDGANKLQQIRYVTLPGMAPTLSIMLILRIGHILNVGYEKVVLLISSNKTAYETGEVISSYVYNIVHNQSSGTGQLSISTAADLFNSLIAMFLVLGSNAISRRVSDTSLF